jgi:hypothetical protein
MARKQTPAQKETVERVMHEFTHGELKIRGNGPKVRNPKQAIAIALHEAGASNQESPRKNKQNLARTKAKERTGETAQDTTEGKGGRKSAQEGAPDTRAALYEEARKKDIPGRSKMSRDELARALHR